MSNENSKNPASASDGQEQPKHESWVKHIVNEIKEEIGELVEEAQNLNPDEFPTLGDGHVNVVHDHHHDN